MDRKITQIIDVVCSSHETGTQGFDALLKSVSRRKLFSESKSLHFPVAKSIRFCIWRIREAELSNALCFRTIIEHSKAT